MQGDPFAYLKAAATGDLAAQRWLADCACDMALDPATDRDAALTLAEGLVFARMAAVHGDANDQSRVIGMLTLLAPHCTTESRRELGGEALARVALAADHGVDLADRLLPELVESAPAQVVAQAKDFRARLTDTIGGAEG